MDDLWLMQIQVEALFTHDAAGRMLCQNEPGTDQPVAPRLFLGRTRAGSVWRFRHDVPEDSPRQVDHLLAREPAVTDLRLPPACLGRLMDILAAQAPVEVTESGPAYRFPAELPLMADVVEITSANVHLLAEVTGNQEMNLPCAAVVSDGRAVSVCQSVRLSAHAHEAGVDTLEAYRSRGYASAAVAGWAFLVHRAGCLPLYSTSWGNLASQGVARRLGLSLYGVDLHLT